MTNATAKPIHNASTSSRIVGLRSTSLAPTEVATPAAFKSTSTQPPIVGSAAEANALEFWEAAADTLYPADGLLAEHVNWSTVNEDLLDILRSRVLGWKICTFIGGTFLGYWIVDLSLGLGASTTAEGGITGAWSRLNGLQKLCFAVTSVGTGFVE